MLTSAHLQPPCVWLETLGRILCCDSALNGTTLGCDLVLSHAQLGQSHSLSNTDL